jgi:hypothetical protein
VEKDAPTDLLHADAPLHEIVHRADALERDLVRVRVRVRVRVGASIRSVVRVRVGVRVSGQGEG